MLSGSYAWRHTGTGILPGDAKLILPTDGSTLQALFQKNGYRTGIVGKWHLGLGTQVEKDWNKHISPGPKETGFDYSFIFPATADRVPTVFLENQNVVGLDPKDPITVSYANKVGNDATGKDHPELLKIHPLPHQGHQQTIVNNIGRMGYMTGGQMARWTDEELSLTFLAKSKQFIEENSNKPFFLYYALTEPHAPRVPPTFLKGKSAIGARGDVILAIDYAVGEITKQLKYLGIEENTIIIFSSDNGPVLQDGYEDGSLAKLNGHQPAGPLRGGKYSIFEGGTRLPFIVSWPKHLKKGTSEALISQVDLLASFAQLFNTDKKSFKDSQPLWEAMTGKDKFGRSELVEQSKQVALLAGDWKYIPPTKGSFYDDGVQIELGNVEEPQLYNLKTDIGEQKNLATTHPDKLKSMAEKLEKLETAQ